jgi:aryl-alcohol dehydrogenase-like predicted oxidoreductase
MDYVKLGNSGLDVSRICLGCMGFGMPAPVFMTGLSAKRRVKR